MDMEAVEAREAAKYGDWAHEERVGAMDYDPEYDDDDDDAYDDGLSKGQRDAIEAATKMLRRGQRGRNKPRVNHADTQNRYDDVDIFNATF
jgi:hypothetical protein